MIGNFKRDIKVLYNRVKWKIKNKNNYTHIRTFFDIDKVSVGNYTYGEINVETYDCEGSLLSIGSYCSIGNNVWFITGGVHNLNTISTYTFHQMVLQDGNDERSKGPIVVDDDVWIGHGVTVLSGVHIGQGAVIAAGAVVSKDVPPYAIVGGVPCKIIRYRFSDEIIKELLKIDYENLSKEQIRENINFLYEPLINKDQLCWMPRK